MFMTISFWWNRLIPYAVGWPFEAGTPPYTGLIRSCFPAFGGISLTWVMVCDGRILYAQMTWLKFFLQPFLESNSWCMFEAGGQSDLVPFLLSYGKKQKGGRGIIKKYVNEYIGHIVSAYILLYCLFRPLTFSLIVQNSTQWLHNW